MNDLTNWQIRPVTPDDTLWEVWRTVRTTAGKFKVEKQRRLYSNPESAQVCADKLNTVK